MRSPGYATSPGARKGLATFAARIMAQREIDRQHTAARQMARLKLAGPDLAQALMGASPAEVGRLEADHADEIAAWI